MTFENLPVLLQAREQELTAIYENVPGIVFYIAVSPDSEFRFISVSRDFLTATGLSREQVVGSLVRDVIPPPSRDLVLNHYREAIRSGQPVRWEEQSVYPAGQRCGEVAVTPLYDASGLATHLIGIVHDITERKRLEEKRAENLLEAAPDAMVVMAQTGRIVLVNAQTERLFGYLREEIIGQPVEILIPRRFHERHQSHRTTFFSDPRVRPMGAQLDLFGLRKDGSEFPVEVSLSPIKSQEGYFITAAIRDISERKQHEEAIRASERRLRLAQQVARIGTFERDLRTRSMSWAAGLDSLYGLSPGSLDGKDVAFARFKDLIHPSDWEGFQHLTQESLKTGQPTNGEWRAIWPDGSVHWIAARWQALMDESGEPSRVVGANMDVTERRRSEERLREYEKAVEGAEDIIGVVDREYRLLLANRQYLKMRNLTREQVVGHFVPEILGTEVFETVIKPKLDECFQGKVVKYEMRFSYPMLGERDLSLSYFPIEGNKGVDRAVCILHDITDRKRAEEELRESEERLRLAAQAGRMFAYSWDAATDVIERSGESTDILGVSNNEAATGAAVSAMVHPEDRQKLQAAFANLTVEQPTLRITYRIIRPDGVVIWVERNSRGYFDSQGKLKRVVGMVVDVTERKRAKEALAEMTRRLVAAQEQERARIARELHDDINQRLAILSVELEQLQQSPTELKIRVQELRKQLRQISDDVQAISHDLHSSKLEYLGAIGGMKSWCREIAERHKIEVVFRSGFSGNLPLDLGLPLFRVLQEAVNNSIKHSEQKQVEVQLFEESSEIHLIVRDSGKGFDVDKALGGKGLGLTSMRERVRLVNGTIAIESRPMAGTNIQVRIPLVERTNADRLSA